jgi:hypothetical protein
MGGKAQTERTALGVRVGRRARRVNGRPKVIWEPWTEGRPPQSDLGTPGRPYSVFVAAVLTACHPGRGDVNSAIISVWL